MNYTTKEATTIRDAYNHLHWMVEHTSLTHDLDDALKAARAMGSTRNPATIREREAGVIGAFLQGFKAPKKINAAGMHGCSRWWQIAVMAGARFRAQYHPAMVQDAKNPPHWMDERSRAYKRRQVKQAAKARRMMRDAVEAHITARHRFIDSL